MIIERTKKEIIIKLPANINTDDLQQLVDYLTYKEAVSESKAKQPDIDKLSKEIKKDWWKNNRHRFIKQ